MLVLDNISKDYEAGDSKVSALKGVSIKFRRSEFVSILGQSGCGKTTLLNIIGGLDQYTSGDLIINGVSTKQFKDADWDTYRNHSIGFVFQSYNLIPHQSVLSNVELALTLSGVSKAERRRRAVEALEKVGLGDQLRKKPNQMSGGQMQRVAIARALVNDPDILLADEPTGALDTETSVQVMDILREVAKDRLVIMVTHNPDLANTYSTRIIRLLDGRIIDDSMPFDGAEEAAPPAKSDTKKAMSFFTAISLSLNNLMTKKGRTILTAFAGSIGIIGIALILSISTGVNDYIDRVQEDTLSSYPILLEAESVDMGGLITSLMGVSSGGDEEGGKHDRDAVYTSAIMYDLLNAMSSAEVEKNNLTAFKEYLENELNGESPKTGLKDYVSAVQYDYALPLSIYTQDVNDTIIKSDFLELWNSMFTSMTGSSSEGTDAASLMKMYSSFGTGSNTGVSIWIEILPGQNGELISPLLNEQYDVIAGRWPEASDELILIVDKNNEVSDVVLYALGLKDSAEMYDMAIRLMTGETVDTETLESWSYDEILSKTFKYVYPADCYQPLPEGGYADVSKSELGLKTLYANGKELKIVGIVRQNEDAISGMMSGAIAYTSALTKEIIEETADKELVKLQLDDENQDVISGLPFKTDDAEEISVEEKVQAVKDYFAEASEAKKAEIYTEFSARPSEEYVSQQVSDYMQTLTRSAVEEMVNESYPEYAAMLPDMDDETLFSYVEEMAKEEIRRQYSEGVRAQLGTLSTVQLAGMLDMQSFTDEDYSIIFDEIIPQRWSDSTYEDTLKLLGYVDMDSPAKISIYASTFADKDKIADIITQYNSSVSEGDKISYTDYVALMMSSITTIINAISYVLIAFVAISLIVSSIMIGIITYISVLERTKEIGILRSIGASKRDISRVFNAETLIVGLCAGIIGIVCTLLLCLPINAIIHHLTGIMILNATIPPVAAVILVAISVVLTVIAGLIPSGLASRKDPVIALRTE
jgi:putative ABC transport system permease protein